MLNKNAPFFPRSLNVYKLVKLIIEPNFTWSVDHLLRSLRKCCSDLEPISKRYEQYQAFAEALRGDA